VVVYVVVSTGGNWVVVYVVVSTGGSCVVVYVVVSTGGIWVVYVVVSNDRAGAIIVVVSELEVYVGCAEAYPAAAYEDVVYGVSPYENSGVLA